VGIEPGEATVPGSVSSGRNGAGPCRSAGGSALAYATTRRRSPTRRTRATLRPHLPFPGRRRVGYEVEPANVNGTADGCIDGYSPSRSTAAYLAVRRRCGLAYRPTRLQEAHSSTGASPRVYSSYSKPSLIWTLYSTISPPSTRAVDWITSTVRMFRTVLLARGHGLTGRVAHECALVPTISLTMITPI